MDREFNGGSAALLRMRAGVRSTPASGNDVDATVAMRERVTERGRRAYYYVVMPIIYLLYGHHAFYRLQPAMY